MLSISFKPSLIRQVNKLEEELVDEVFEKIELFRNPLNHGTLRVHKLHGRLKNCFSFSVNYRFRIVFTWQSKNEAVLLILGDHDIYK
jgi:plasmid maintenance system killer protein